MTVSTESSRTVLVGTRQTLERRGGRALRRRLGGLTGVLPPTPGPPRRPRRHSQRSRPRSALRKFCPHSGLWESPPFPTGVTERFSKPAGAAPPAGVAAEAAGSRGGRLRFPSAPSRPAWRSQRFVSLNLVSVCDLRIPFLERLPRFRGVCGTGVRVAPATCFLSGLTGAARPLGAASPAVRIAVRRCFITGPQTFT